MGCTVDREALRAAVQSLRAAGGCRGQWMRDTAVHRRLWWWYRLHQSIRLADYRRGLDRFMGRETAI